MKFLLSFLAYGTLVAAGTATYGKRQGSDVQTAQDAIQSIIDSSTALKAEVDQYQSGQGEQGDLANAAINLINTINAGNTSVSGIGQLDDTDSLSLAGPVNTLAQDTSNTIDSLIAKKPDIVADCLGFATLQILQQTQQDADSFATTLTSKIAPNEQSTAAFYAGEIDADFQRGLAAYADQSPLSCACGGDCPSTTTTTTTTSDTGSTTTGITTTTSNVVGPTSASTSGISSGSSTGVVGPTSGTSTGVVGPTSGTSTGVVGPTSGTSTGSSSPTTSNGGSNPWLVWTTSASTYSTTTTASGNTTPASSWNAWTGSSSGSTSSSPVWTGGNGGSPSPKSSWNTWSSANGGAQGSQATGQATSGSWQTTAPVVGVNTTPAARTWGGNNGATGTTPSGPISTYAGNGAMPMVANFGALAVAAAAAIL